jgi:hypothetical protein
MSLLDLPEVMRRALLASGGSSDADRSVREAMRMARG